VRTTPAARSRRCAARHPHTCTEPDQVAERDQAVRSAELVEGEREHERLGDGLDREPGVVAERHRRAPRIDDGHREPLGIGRGELGDVLGRRSAVLPAHLVEHGTEHLAHWIHALDPSEAPMPCGDHRGSAAPGARRDR